MYQIYSSECSYVLVIKQQVNVPNIDMNEYDKIDEHLKRGPKYTFWLETAVNI